MNKLAIILIMSIIVGLNGRSSAEGTDRSQSSRESKSRNRYGNCDILTYAGGIPLNKTKGYHLNDIDFRGGLSCKVKVSSSLPIFTINCVGKDDNTFEKIMITQNDNLVQTIDLANGYIDPNEIYYISGGGDILVDTDENSDGYKDLNFLQHGDLAPEPFWASYRYNPETKSFNFFTGDPKMAKETINNNENLKWEWPAGRPIKSGVLVQVESVHPAPKGLSGVQASPSMANALPDAVDVTVIVDSKSSPLGRRKITIQLPGIEAKKLKMGGWAAFGLLDSGRVCACVQTAPKGNLEELRKWIAKWECPA